MRFLVFDPCANQLDPTMNTALALICASVLAVVFGALFLWMLYRNFAQQIEILKAQYERLQNENGELMKQIGLLMEASVKKLPPRVVEYVENAQYEVFAYQERLVRAKIEKLGEADQLQREIDNQERIMDQLRNARTANGKKEKQL